MTSRQPTNWGLVAAVSLIAMTIAALVVLFVAEDLAWLAVVIFVIGLVDAFFLWRVIPRMTGATTQDQLARMSAEADAEAEAEIKDGDWGVAPPSEPAEPRQDD